MSEKIKLSLMILAIGIAYGGYEFYDFFEGEQVQLQSTLQAKTTEINGIKEELNKLKNFSSHIEEVKANLKKTNLEYEEVLEIIPRSLDYSKLLFKLNSLAQNSGVEIENFKPKDKASTLNAAPMNTTQNEASEQQTQNQTKFFEEADFDIQLRGGFSQTLMFLDQVSRLKRIINVNNLNMSFQGAAENRVLASGTTMLSTVAVFRTYKFIE